MKTNNNYIFIAIITLAFLISGCALTESTPTTPPVNPTQEATSTPLPTKQPQPNYPIADINFTVSIPKNTPPDQEIYLNILDEVTGLALNTQAQLMTKDENASDEGNRIYKITIPFPVGSSIKYRYARKAESIMVTEHNPDGEPVRYRLFYVDGPGSTNDIVSRWTDTPFEAPTGYLSGRVTDASTNNPIPDLLIAVGGVQTVTDSDGSFSIDALPSGTHNLVVYSKDGSYQPFQQGALVAPDLPTIAPIELSPRGKVKVTFNVSFPENTPPLVPIRIAGNLQQLGNSFTTLLGGMSGVTENMPVLSQTTSGYYSLTIELPIGTFVSYKYTLGDGFWNAEHTEDGEFQLRTLIVPNHNLIVNESVSSWQSNENTSITFNVQVPENTPKNDYVSIQFNPIFGWTEPIPMWQLGENHWGYILFSPLNLPGNLSYRYCRNNECGTADDIATPGLYGAGRTIDLNDLPMLYDDQVEAWVDLDNN
jgi:hypothetical protein